ncbi:MAG: NAD-dependent epimerase/dehydratase family protein [Candidatus Sumerlaeia bacterium]|nr:NAD-dependent epimerase/dehydratase family protein [Candidatus Sumerlaeia bacterium]
MAPPVKITITGMEGFVGSHLRDRLVRESGFEVPFFWDRYFSDPKAMEEILAGSQAVVHLAAMNRGDPETIYSTNIALVKQLVAHLEHLQAAPHVIFASSTQVDFCNPYGLSKKEGARILEEWAKRHNAPLSILIIPNIFGDGGRPYYNSVVATFCHQLTHGEEPRIIEDREVNLIYINELTDLICERIQNPPRGIETVRVQPTATIKVSAILALLQKYKDLYYRDNIMPAFANAFERNLFNAFLCYMDYPDLARPATVHSDARGWLFEAVKQQGGGMVFFSLTHPGIIRGNHYHTRKIEKFLVVQGCGVVRLRRIGKDSIIEYPVTGENPTLITIPIFHTHNIENTGPSDMLTLFWSSEIYDPGDPDTFPEKV